MIPPFMLDDRAALEDEARRMCSTARLTEEHLLCRVLGRYLMYVEPRDLDITPHLALNGCWEPWITLALARLIRPGWQCIDVGANVGYYTLLMAAAAGAQGRVMAIEPNPRAARLLGMNIQVNGLADRVEVHCCAAGAEDCGQALLVLEPNRPGRASVRVPPGPRSECIEVTSTTLDRLSAGWSRVDLVKIDAEGAEPQIWQGMSGLLGRNEGIVVALEFAPARYPDAERFIGEIAAQGFALRQVAADGEPVPVCGDEIAAARARGDWLMLLLMRG